MIDESTWNAMSTQQQEAAWLSELATMLQTALAEWRAGLRPGNAQTTVASGAFNVVVGRRPA